MPDALTSPQIWWAAFHRKKKKHAQANPNYGLGPDYINGLNGLKVNSNGDLLKVSATNTLKLSA